MEPTTAFMFISVEQYCSITKLFDEGVHSRIGEGCRDVCLVSSIIIGRLYLSCDEDIELAAISFRLVSHLSTYIADLAKNFFSMYMYMGLLSSTIEEHCLGVVAVDSS